MNTDEIIETAVQGHSSTRDAICWAIQQEREACAKVCEAMHTSEESDWHWSDTGSEVLKEAACLIRARSNDD
jgi:hypothetical protein